MATLTVISEVPATSIAQARLDVDFPDKWRSINGVIAWMDKLRGGTIGGGAGGGGTMRVTLAAARAASTVTCAFAPVTLGTTALTIGAVTLTVVAVPANENQLANGASDAALAVNLANAINAHSVLSSIVKAVAVGATVVITSFYPGAVGNMIPISKVNNGFTVVGTFLTGGTGDEMDEFSYGFAL